MVCPFCSNPEPVIAPVRGSNVWRWSWPAFGRGALIGLNVIAGILVVYFALFVIAFFGGFERLELWLTRLLFWR